MTWVSAPGPPQAAYIDWLTISDQTRSVVDDVQRIRRHPLVPPTIPIYGYVFDVKTGASTRFPGPRFLGSNAP